ncbi:MAG TPA: amidohydrolase [Planctomycetota bacterium]|nr:amidohydrolase [Planctomycetota bacterium]
MTLPAAEFGDEINGPLWAAVDNELPALVDLYKWFHANPELSFKEARTSERMAGELKALGCEVVQGIAGTGVVGLLRNGPGPWVLARADMDALPVLEETGLPYASRSGVMHACGHDSHMAIVVGAARALGRLKDRWSGTLVVVGQPAEEIGSGAKRMLEDPRFHQAVAEKPAACLSIHDFPTPAGTLGVTSGYASANVDNLDLTIYGRGGHGAWPHLCVDPVVIGAELVLALQTIVSRKVEPGVRAIVTVGAFNAGAKHNVIPDEGALKLTVRSYDDKTRAKLLDEILHLATQVCAAHRSPKPPVLREADDFCPAGYHDPAFTTRIRGVFERLVGGDKVYDAEPMMGGEDFSRFPLYWKVPGLQFRVGGARANHDRAVGLHSSRWAVDPEPTLRTGATALARAMLDVLKKRP